MVGLISIVLYGIAGFLIFNGISGWGWYLGVVFVFSLALLESMQTTAVEEDEK